MRTTMSDWAFFCCGIIYAAVAMLFLFAGGCAVPCDVPADDAGGWVEPDAEAPMSADIAATTACDMMRMPAIYVDDVKWCGRPECPFQAEATDGLRCDPRVVEACWLTVRQANDCEHYVLALENCGACLGGGR